jgi:hypothetical protein
MKTVKDGARNMKMSVISARALDHRVVFRALPLKQAQDKYFVFTREAVRYVHLTYLFNYLL